MGSTRLPLDGDPEAPITQDSRPESSATVLDLFSGAGGLSAAFSKAGGYRTLQAVEMDIAAAATYAQNHPEADLFVGPIEEWLREDDVPEADVVVGGPPCQGFSTLGKQDVEDARNSLWREYAQTVERAKPQYFVVENVAAFLKSPQIRQFRRATWKSGRLSDYTFKATVLNAADFGAPQSRKRAVMIGHHRDLPFPGWPTPTHEGAHVPVRTALARVPRVWKSVELPTRTVSFHGRELPGVFRTRDLHVGRDYSDLSIRRFARIPEGGNRFDLPDELLAPCWRAHRTGSGDVMGRLHWDRPAVTIRTEFFKPEKGRYLHPDAPRAITHLEAALLQGFDRDYKWVGSKTAIARQIGNAVPIPLGVAIAKTLKRALES